MTGNDRIVAKPGQSLGGLVLEAAAALGERTMGGVLAEAGSSLLALVHHSIAPDELAVVAMCLDLGSEDLIARRHAVLVDDWQRRSFFSVPIDARLLEKRTRRFSPATLRENVWHRASWQLRPFPFCEVSWTFVTDKCHACGTVQGWSRTWGPELCDVCTASLGEGSTAEVPVELQPALHLAAGLLHHDETRRTESLNALPKGLRMLGSEGCMDVLCAVAGVFDPSLRMDRHRHLLDASAEPAEITRAVADAWELMRGWPDAFLAENDRRLARRAGRFGDGNRGATQFFFGLAEREGVPRALRRAVGDLLGVVADRQKGYLDARSFSKASGVTAGRVARSRRAGLVRSVIGLNDKGRITPMLLASEAERSRRRAVDGILVERAAARLGCTFRAVEELTALGVLIPSPEVVDNSQPDRRKIEIASLDGLFDGLLRRSVSPNDGGFDIPLKRAMWAVGGRLKPWSAVFVALLEGRIPSALLPGEEPLTSRLLVRECALPALQALLNGFDDADPRFADHMSKSDAYDVLNTEGRVAEGLLDEWESLGGLYRTVPAAELLGLARRLVSRRELAARVGTSTRHMTGMLSPMGVHPRECDLYDREEAVAALGC